MTDTEILAHALTTPPPRIMVDASTHTYSGMPVWLPRARMQLQGLARLQVGWNSYGAASVSAALTVAAFDLLRQLVSYSTPRPALVPTSDGSVQIEWHTRGMHVEIRVLTPTRLRVFVEDTRGALPTLEDRVLDYDIRSIKNAIVELSSRAV